jgi:hypothetical protein
MTGRKDIDELILVCIQERFSAPPNAATGLSGAIWRQAISPLLPAGLTPFTNRSPDASAPNLVEYMCFWQELPGEASMSALGPGCVETAFEVSICDFL